MGHRDSWSKDEEDFIRRNYKDLSDFAMGRALGRTESAVSTHRLQMGLNKNAPCGSRRSVVNQLYSKYKCGAERRSYRFNLSKEYFSFLIHQKCYYCGEILSMTFDNKSRAGAIKHNGIDRLDSNKGYTKDNCVACCKTCNLAKQSLSPKEFIQHCKEVAHNN